MGEIVGFLTKANQVMTTPVPFLVRRARVIRGETQDEFAKFLGVDGSTVSRWERGKVEPSAAVLQTISEIVQRADPTHSEAYISRSPLMQIICRYDDFRETVQVSRGIMEAHSLTPDHWDYRWFKTVWTPDDERVNELVHADPRWQNQEIAFFETQHLATIGWIRTIAAPLPDPRGILWEGAIANGDDLAFWVRLTPYESVNEK